MSAKKVKTFLKHWVPLYLAGIIGFIAGLACYMLIMFNFLVPQRQTPELSMSFQDYTELSTDVENPDMQLVNVFTNDTLNFASLRNKTIFVNFWTSYCGPCLHEMPSISRLKTLVSDSVQFLLISDEPLAHLQKFCRDKKFDKFDLPFYHIKGAVPEPFTGQMVPRTYILKDNTLYLSRNGSAKWDAPEVVKMLQ